MARSVDIIADDLRARSEPASRTPTAPPTGWVKRDRYFFPAALIIVLLATAAIITAAQGDLWLDEVWSLKFAGESTSLLDIVRTFRHDNNHVLNTIYLYLVGPDQPLFVYRLLSVVAGIGSVVLAGYVAGRDWGRREALYALATVGSSYPLLLYFSEARGYAPAIFCGLAAYAALGRYPLGDRPWRLGLFWSVCVLGVLAHATFVILIVAFGCWGAAQSVLGGESTRTGLSRFLRWHAVPLAFLGVWQTIFISQLEIGGGPELDKVAVIGHAAALALGLPNNPAFRAIAIVLLLGMIILGAMVLRRLGDSRWVFFPMAIVLSPALLLLASRPQHFYFRYFLICFPFILLLLARIAGWCATSLHWPGRWAGLAAVALVVALQWHRDLRLFTLGRGEYAGALKLIDESSSGDIVRVGSDHDFRNRLLFDFYSARLGRTSRLQYVDRPAWPQGPPDWIITHTQDGDSSPPSEIEVSGVGRYNLVKEYGFSGDSGWSWQLFRRDR